jgi:hypothetical protein
MNKKLEKFIKRNQKRNSHLYESGTIEGYDYIVCPISQARLSMIKNNYVTNILGMSLDEYPEINRICEKRKENIKSGLQKIDSVTGMTNYEKGQIKARMILSQTDENGVSGYKKKGQKTRSTHMSKIDELGRNGYARIASKAIIKGNLTKAEKGIITHPSCRDNYYRYKTLVLHLTNYHRQQLTKGYITGLAGKPGAWHIDHKFSIIQGFREKISPFVIGHYENLQMLPWKQNIQKLHRCDISKEDLFGITGYNHDKNQQEFEIINQLIQDDIEHRISPNASYLIERFYESDIR